MPTLTRFLHGGEEAVQRREKMMAEFEQVSAFTSAEQGHLEDLSRDEVRHLTMKQVRAAFRMLIHDRTSEERMLRVRLLNLVHPGWSTRQGVHFGLFFGAVQGQGDEEQVAEWASRAMGLNIFGCFGMTEMGHGSHVRGIETTATFVPGAGPDGDGEWDIHTPSLTATKWWIGGLAHTATHMALYARTITADGVDHGVHCFLVPLRDRESGVALPGITIGDCGAKMGRHGIDNGWVQFHHVRLPRRALLMKNVTVCKQGIFSRKPQTTKQMAYGALIGGRAFMVQDSGDFLQHALTIAIRFGAMRRQGESLKEASSAESAPGSALLETQLLDYGSHQAILMPLLAHAYAFHMTGKAMTDLVHELQDTLDPKQAAALVGDVHATSAGLKAYCTWKTCQGIDLCRQCCGGHGYSAYNRLGGMLDDFHVQLTWEGSNTVMALQTARQLVTAWRRVQGGGQVAGPTSYLQGHPHAPSLTTPAMLEQWQHQHDILRCLAATAVQQAAAALTAADGRGTPPHETVQRTVGAQAVHAAASAAAPENVPPTGSNGAWNAAAPLLLHASKCHVYLTMAEWFQAAVQAAESQGQDPENVSALARLRSLFVMDHLLGCLGPLLMHGTLSPTQAAWVSALHMRLCQELRRDAVPLVDAFHLSDFVLGAPLARYDGDIYPAYMKKVLSAAGAQAAPGTPAAKYWTQDILPLLEGEDFVPESAKL